MTTSATAERELADIAPDAAKTSRLQVRGLARYAGVLVWLIMIVVFALTIPDLFLTPITLRTLISDQAITGILALAVLIPLATGLVDLSFASIAGFAAIFTAWLSINTGWNAGLIVVVTLLTAVGFGCLSALFVTKLHVSSIVATLGVSAIAGGLTNYISGGQTLTGRYSPTFARLGSGYWGDVAYPFLYLLGIAAVLFVLLEYTGTGRRMLAVGGNPAAARLAGIHVGRLHGWSLVAGALLSGFAGLLLATGIGQSTDETGTGYLLPALAAVFLGATQVRERANVLGTLLAVYLLGTGVKGTQLSGADPWVSQVLNGVFLLVAVGVAARRSTVAR